MGLRCWRRCRVCPSWTHAANVQCHCLTITLQLVASTSSAWIITAEVRADRHTDAVPCQNGRASPKYKLKILMFHAGAAQDSYVPERQ